MRETDIQLETTDGLGLFAHEWLPEQLVRGVVCVFHGLGEHGGQYGEVAKALADQQIAMIAIDQRGHGRSDGQRGHTPSYEALLDDVDALLSGASDRHPGARRLLYGHSLGGNLVLNHAIRRKRDIAGVIATSPWLRLTNELIWYKRFLGTLLEPLWPTLTFSTSNNREELLEEVGLRRNAELFHNLISLRLLMRTRHAGIWALRHADLLEVPALLIHGDADPVTDPEASLEFTRRGNGQARAVLLPGVAHNPHEEDHSTISMIVDWVVARLLAG